MWDADKTADVISEPCFGVSPPTPPDVAQSDMLTYTDGDISPGGA